MSAIFGESEARALFGVAIVIVVVGGSKDVAFNQEISDLVGTVRIPPQHLANRTRWALDLGGHPDSEG